MPFFNILRDHAPASSNTLTRAPELNRATPTGQRGHIANQEKPRIGPTGQDRQPGNPIRHPLGGPLGDPDPSALWECALRIDPKKSILAQDPPKNPPQRLRHVSSVCLEPPKTLLEIKLAVSRIGGGLLGSPARLLRASWGAPGVSRGLLGVPSLGVSTSSETTHPHHQTH